VLSAAGSLTFANVLSRFLAFAGLLAAVGIAVFDLFFWRPFARRALPTGALTIGLALVFLGAHGLTHASHGEGWNRFSVVWEAGGVWAAVGATLAAIGLADPRVRPVAARLPCRSSSSRRSRGTRSIRAARGWTSRSTCSTSRRRRCGSAASLRWCSPFRRGRA
jgi:hypothetical protein